MLYPAFTTVIHQCIKYLRTKSTSFFEALIKKNDLPNLSICMSRKPSNEQARWHQSAFQEINLSHTYPLYLTKCTIVWKSQSLCIQTASYAWYTKGFHYKYLSSTHVKVLTCIIWSHKIDNLNIKIVYSLDMLIKREAFRAQPRFCCNSNCSSSSADLYRNAADSRYPDINCLMVATSLELSWFFEDCFFMLKSVGPAKI